NAGAIMCCALVQQGKSSADSFDFLTRQWQRLAGGEKAGFNNAVYLSERKTADRNFALGYLMRENRVFPPDTDLVATLEFYFQCCSIEVNARQMSVIAATLANGGVCPLTGERVFNASTVQSCLSLMATCGLYDFSGEFAFTIGLPAKSGVSGAIMVVVPNVCGFCMWSPRLDEIGNSVRGVALCQRLVERFRFHNFDTLGGGAKQDPRVHATRRRAQQANEVIWAASKGDIGGLQRYLVDHAAGRVSDYDLRTPLHLAAAEGQLATVEFLLARGWEVNCADRWGATPADDAQEAGHAEVLALLARHGGRPGRPALRPDPAFKGSQPLSTLDSELVGMAIWAAAEGDVGTLKEMSARGFDLSRPDYDGRTPLHLAVAEARLAAASYLLAQGVPPSPRDRWGSTPLDEARRLGDERLAALFEAPERAAGGE
ncbi:MAG: hypothetical protein FJ138_08250, partial [Deltaproteobacteria bacterium]|nr:hypothetical protein [Deltaproteobacteria bacterium]